MFYTMTLRGRNWNCMEVTTEGTGTWWNIIRNSMERYGNTQKLLVSYSPWARLAPTLTHVVTRDPMTSGAEDGRCHLRLIVTGSKIIRQSHRYKTIE